MDFAKELADPLATGQRLRHRASRFMLAPTRGGYAARFAAIGPECPTPKPGKRKIAAPVLKTCAA
jgi:hypothetical protein